MTQRNGRAAVWGYQTLGRVGTGLQGRKSHASHRGGWGTLEMKTFFVDHRLAFGSAITCWEHVERLSSEGITHVINLRRSRNRFVQEFPNLWLPYKDDLKPRPAQFYSRALSFYKSAMRQQNAKLLVMCHHAYQRSPSLVYFLLRASGTSAQNAAAMIAGARRSARIVRAYRNSAETFLVRLGSRKISIEVRHRGSRRTRG